MQEQVIEGFFDKRKKKEAIERVMCPSCERSHIWNNTGVYCSMACYYNKIWRRK